MTPPYLPNANLSQLLPSASWCQFCVFLNLVKMNHTLVMSVTLTQLFQMVERGLSLRFELEDPW